MPGDIRSFFGGKPPPAGLDGTMENGRQSGKKPAKKGRAARKILDDSDDGEPEPSPKKSSTRKPAAKKREATPEGETTTTSDYFGKSKAKKVANDTPKPSPATTTSNRATPASKLSARVRKRINYTEKATVLDDDDEDDKDDIFAADYKKGDDYEASDDEEPLPQRPKPAPPSKKKLIKDEDVEMVDPPQESLPKSKKPAAKKRKSVEADDDDDDLDDKPKKKPRATKKDKDDVPESAEIKAIFDSIPTIRPPTPPTPTHKFEYRGKANSGPAPAAGSKEIPTGAENCLAGLTFVFTGLLDTLNRDDGQMLVKRYGGKTTTGPSSKTSYIVLGADAGPSKLQKIAEFNLKTINEDGLFELIRRLPANGGDSKLATKSAETKQKEMAKVKQMAAEAEAEEKRKAASAKPKTTTAGGRMANEAPPAAGPDTRLWTVKYSPSQINQICGNKGQVEKLQRWLKNFPLSKRRNFKVGGPDGSGTYRAILIHGPPGIGKTTAAHLIAKLEGYDIVESNASDTRSKKLVDAGMKGMLNTTSLLGYFAGDDQDVDTSKKKLCLIMDEVDGMSAGDRGGVGALAATCRKTQIPMILICNDKRLPKMKPFDFCTFDLAFRRPSKDQIKTRIMTIAFREKMKIPPTVIDALIEGSNSDIRQVVNMISTTKTDEQIEDSTSLDFDKSKEMSKAWEKHVVLKPWDILSKILGGGLFSPASKTTLNQKIELYFNDHDIAPLMLAENYLGTSPILANNQDYSKKKRDVKILELVDSAATAFSEGDLVNQMIRGGDQLWSLMPAHAILGFVRPASFVAGSMAGNAQPKFPAWLGKNSTDMKSQRQIKEIQGHMRLRSSGDRHEIRQQYMPLLWHKLIKKLEVEGKDGVQSTIDLMDSYFLTKDDWEAILELGVGSMHKDSIKLDPPIKSMFTRLYHQASHPMPFMKSTALGQPKANSKSKPDLDEAIDESDDDEVVEEIKEESEGEDAETALTKDKYVAKPKKKSAASANKGKTKSKKKGEDEDEDEEADEMPKKTAKGKGKAATKKSK